MRISIGDFQIGEEERAIIRVVDDRTGQVIQQVRKNMEVARPIWLTAKESYIDDTALAHFS